MRFREPFDPCHDPLPFFALQPELQAITGQVYGQIRSDTNQKVSKKNHTSHLVWLHSERWDSAAASHNRRTLSLIRIAIIHGTNDLQLSLQRDEWKVSSPPQALQPWALSRAHPLGSSPCYCMATPPQLCKDVTHQRPRALEDTTSLFPHTACLESHCLRGQSEADR